MSPTSLGGFRLDVTYGAGKFVAAGRAENVAVSTDGMEWTTEALPEGTSLESNAYGNGVFVGAGVNARLVRSANAINWEIVKENDKTAGRYRGISYTNGLFIAGGDKGLLYTSPDGITWTKRVHESATNMSKSVYLNGHYIIKDTLSATQRADIDDIQLTADLHSWTTEGVSLSDRHPVGNAHTFTARITGEAGTVDERYIRIRWSLVQ